MKKYIGIFLSVLILVTMVPIISTADTALKPQDSADYFKLADPVAAGTTTEADEYFFTGNSMASYGNTYLEVVMADDFAGTKACSGIYVKKILIDYDKITYPSDGRVYTGVYLIDNQQNIIGDLNEIVKQKIPSAMSDKLMKWEWTIGTKYGILNSEWKAEHAVIRNYVAPPTKDMLDKYAPYLIDRINDNEVTGSATDPMARTAISSQQMSTYRLYVYSTTINGWTDGAQSYHIKGSVFPNFYVDAKAFTEIKLDVDSMGDNVKKLLVEKIPRAELAKAGYTDEELDKIGYTDDYKFTLKKTDLSADMNIEYKFVNNSSGTVNAPAILAVGYDNEGKVISANVVNVNDTTVAADGGKYEGAVKLISDSTPASVVCYVLNSLENPAPVTSAASISHSYVKATPDTYKLGFEIGQNSNGTMEFVVNGTLADGKTTQAFVAVTKQGKQVKDLVKGVDAKDIFLFAEQTVTNENGGYGFKFDIDSSVVEEGSSYTAWVWYGDGKFHTATAKHEKPAEPVKPTVTFDDINDAAWAKDYIEKLANAGYVNGKDGKNFKPNDYITREEFVKILVSALDIDASKSEAIFNDVPANAWYAGYVTAAYKNGIVNGDGTGGFGTGGNITRQDLATMVYRAAKITGADTKNKFADDEEIMDYAKEAVYALNSAGVLNGKGDNLFAPKALATRAEASKIIYLAIIGE